VCVIHVLISIVSVVVDKNGYRQVPYHQLYLHILVCTLPAYPVNTSIPREKMEQGGGKVPVVIYARVGWGGVCGVQCSGSTGSRIHMFLDLPDSDPLVRGMDLDPDPSIIKQK
jgi:hypothetical protein